MLLFLVSAVAVLAVMENERLRITLDKPDKVYIAGQTIKGEIWLNLTKRAKIRGKFCDQFIKLKPQTKKNL